MPFARVAFHTQLWDRNIYIYIIGDFSIGNIHVKGFLVNPKLNQSYPKIFLLLEIAFYSQNIPETVTTENIHYGPAKIRIKGQSHGI